MMSLTTSPLSWMNRARIYKIVLVSTCKYVYYLISCVISYIPHPPYLHIKDPLITKHSTKHFFKGWSVSKYPTMIFVRRKIVFSKGT